MAGDVNLFFNDAENRSMAEIEVRAHASGPVHYPWLALQAAGRCTAASLGSIHVCILSRSCTVMGYMSRSLLKFVSANLPLGDLLLDSASLKACAYDVSECGKKRLSEAVCLLMLRRLN